MPRTRRTPASETPAAEDAAPVETPPVASEGPSSEKAVTNDAAALTSPNTETNAPKPTRRRGTRQPKAEAAPEAAPEAEAPAAQPSATEETPPRRRGRRTAAPESPAAPPPAAETAAPTRRRGRRSASPEAAPEPAPFLEADASTPDLEAPVVPETPPAPARRRGRRMVAPETATPAAPAPVEASPPASGSRRRGRGRQAEPASDPVVPEIVAEAAEEALLEEAVPPPRRGRRRASDVSAAPQSLELPDVEAPVEPSVSGEEPGGEVAEEGSKGGRRSRRGRRRRGGSDEPTTEMLEAAGAGLLLEEVVEVETPDEDEDDIPLAYPPPAPPVFVAPAVVPPVLPPASEASAPRLTARITREGRGLPRISVSGAGINSQSHLPYLFFVNAEAASDSETVEAQIRQAAENGIHLFSGVMYLPLRNAYGDRSFGAIDALVQQALAADPDGYLLPRLQFFPTNYWARTHADQMALGVGGEEGDVSLASTEFWADCVDALEALVAHFADPETPGGDRILGFHLDRGEWFNDSEAGHDLSLPNVTAFQHWLHAKYQALHALRAAWHDADVTWEDAAVPTWPGKAVAVKKTDTPLYSARREGRWPDYAQYSSELVAGIIAGLASAIKVLSQNRMIVAVSYGYTLEFAGRSDSGHLALGKLLQSPDIDIVAGPNAYAGRNAGSPAAFSAPLDSVALHGKLWLVEDDTKTFLAEAETDDTYNPKIASGADTQAIHQRHFGAALAHRAGVTWMDLWGQGWLNSPEIWHELGGLASQAGRWERLVPAPPVAPDVAVLVDEASLRFLKNDPNGLGTHLVSRTRDLVLRAGASVGFYLQSDITRPNFPESKLCLFLNALRLTTEERAAVREKLQKPGRTLAWLYAPGVFDENGPTVEEAGEVVGMALRPQPWNSRGGSVVLETKHPIADRLKGTKKIGQEEILNPLYAVSDPQATVVAEYAASGAPSLATREHKSGWKSVFFGDPYLTIDLLRGLYAYANVPVYDGQDDCVYAGGDGSLTIHGSFTGQRTLSLPRRASVYDVGEDKIIAADTRSFRAFVRARTTRVFLWGDGRALAAATGLDLPAQTADAVAEGEAVASPQAPLVSTPPRSSRDLREIAEAEDVLAGFDTSPGLVTFSREPEPTGEIFAAVDTLDVTLTESGTEGEEGSEAAGEGDGTNAPARRSRWQRRRAAARARRDAERQAKLADGSPDSGNAANPPVDIETLLPGLPPRRSPIVPADRVAEIVAADTADDDTQDIPDAVVLGFSDAAVADMADEYGAAEAEGEEASF